MTWSWPRNIQIETFVHTWKTTPVKLVLCNLSTVLPCVCVCIYIYIYIYYIINILYHQYKVCFPNQFRLWPLQRNLFSFEKRKNEGGYRILFPDAVFWCSFIILFRIWPLYVITTVSQFHQQVGGLFMHFIY